MLFIEVHNTDILRIILLNYVNIIASIVAYGCIHVLFLLQINTNGYLVFGNEDVVAVRFTPIPRISADGSTVLIPYSTDLTTVGIEGTYLSYR